MSCDLRAIEVNRPITNKLLNIFWGRFFRKAFRGEVQKWILYKEKVDSGITQSGP